MDIATGVEVVNWVKVSACMGAGLCMGLGALGPSLGQGYIGGKACEAMAKNPESSKHVRAALLMGLIAAETSSIYCLVISLCLLFFV